MAAQQDAPYSEFRNFWTDVLADTMWFTLNQWHQALGVSDDARLIQRNINRECTRRDIDPVVWSDFLRAILSLTRPSDPFEAIDGILSGPSRGRFVLAGKKIDWKGDLCHYERLDRMNESMLPFPIGDGRLLENVAAAIEAGAIMPSLQGGRLGKLNEPVWVTDASMSELMGSDDVRNRLGLRSVNQRGYRLVEFRYRLSYLQKKDSLRAPTVIDSWSGGARRSWIFAKRSGGVRDAEAGLTVDISNGGACQRGVPEAVHSSFIIREGEGREISLRVLLPTTGPPPEVSLIGLLESREI